MHKFSHGEISIPYAFTVSADIEGGLGSLGTQTSTKILVILEELFKTFTFTFFNLYKLYCYT